jgi:hypothetical protein
MIDVSADEMYLDGMDLWLKDDDQLEFGDASDVVVDWDNSNSKLLFNMAAAGKFEFNRNLTSGVTSTAVMHVKQDNTGDDQAAILVEQDASDILAVDIQGWTDLGYTTNAGSAFSSTTVAQGAVRVFRNTTNTYLACSTDGGGTYMYMIFDLTGGATS